MNLRKLFVIPTAILLMSTAQFASAHSFPEQENPAAGEALATPPAQISIRYDAPIEKLFDSLQVLDSAGQNKASGEPQVSADGRELSVPVAALNPGEYTVKWRVVCVDTHHTEGSYTFSVKNP